MAKIVLGMLDRNVTSRYSFIWRQLYISLVILHLEFIDDKDPRETARKSFKNYPRNEVFQIQGMTE